MYKSFGQFLFEASKTAEDVRKEKDMLDKLKDAKKADGTAAKDLENTIKDKDASQDDVKRARLVATKTEATVDKLDAEIKLKAMEDGSDRKKDNGKS